MVSSFADYLLIFYVYSILGWCMEVVYMWFREHKLMNRGFLIGPFCPIYGVGLIGITMLFQNFKGNFAVVFLSIILLCSVLEYTASALLERLFHTRWWDYNDMKFNIHGRICLETMLPFGILGSFALYRINPFLMGIYHRIPTWISDKLLTGIVLLTILDVLVSVYILHMLSLPEGEADHTAEISQRVREELTKRFG